MEGNSTLEKGFLITVEKQDINLNSFIGSYSKAVTPNYVALPLKKKKNVLERKQEKKWSPNVIWSITLNKFHTKKGEE